MNPKASWVIWAAIAPALGNHLWQSTLFGVAAASLTLLLRQNHARTRYWLWLAASVKFLLPFSLLVKAGSFLAWPRAAAGSKTGLYVAMQEIGRPFGDSALPAMPSNLSPAGLASPFHLLPVLLAAVWFCGFVAVLGLWLIRWRGVSATVRHLVPLREGREIETLRRVERAAGIEEKIGMFLAPASLEPGIFGIARPVLLWPEGISPRLETLHLEAILAHELWHVRRRDNLTAAIHMLVEAIFWFHPWVWWVGARLLEERERACDEEVLELGSQREVYAESILKVCEFHAGSPLACLAGVTGADLKKRMECIMSQRKVRKLDFSRKLLLSGTLSAALALPIVAGLFHATQSRAHAQTVDTSSATPAYGAASITPSAPGGPPYKLSLLYTPEGVAATGCTVQTLIESAYGVQRFQIEGAPSWLDSERFDIHASLDKSSAGELNKLDPEQRELEQKRMLQQLLADKFKLALHSEASVVPQYGLTIAENGPKLQKARTGDTYPNGIKDPEGHAGAHLIMQSDGGPVTGQGVSIAHLAGLLSRQLGETVVDNTGLTGTYDFTLKWNPDESGRGSDGRPSAAAFMSIVSAVEEQLGLKLVPQTGPVQILVVDHVEAPRENE